MKDPKEKEVRREVGWIGDDFVELIADVEARRYGVTVLVNAECTWSTPVRDLVEAQMIFDTLEQRLRAPVPMPAGHIHQGVL